MRATICESGFSLARRRFSGLAKTFTPSEFAGFGGCISVGASGALEVMDCGRTIRCTGPVLSCCRTVCSTACVLSGRRTIHSSTSKLRARRTFRSAASVLSSRCPVRRAISRLTGYSTIRAAMCRCGWCGLILSGRLRTKWKSGCIRDLAEWEVLARDLTIGLWSDSKRLRRILSCCPTLRRWLGLLAVELLLEENLYYFECFGRHCRRRGR